MAYTTHMGRFRYIVTLLLLLTYAGQSLAGVGASCSNMGSASGEMSAGMHDMDHSGHDMESASQVSGDSCCDGGGFCSMSHCQSVAALTDTGFAGAIAHAAVYHDARPFSSLNSFSGSHYRPPISR